MTLKSFLLLLAAAFSSIAFTASCSAEIIKEAESFETVVPPDWTSSSSGKLTLSGDHYKAGTRSLRWDWTSPNGVVKVRNKAVGNVLTSRMERAERTFAAWIYNETPLPGQQLRFEFGKDDTVNCSFQFGLDYQGWRLALLTYQRDMNGSARNDMDFMRIRPPKGVSSGTLYFDGVIMNMKVDYRFHARDYQLPDCNVRQNNELMWQSQMYTEQLKEPEDLLQPVTDQQRDAIKKFENFYTVSSSKQVSEKELAEAKNRFASWNISKNGGIISGVPLRFRHTNVYEGEHKKLADFTTELYALTLLSRRPFDRPKDEAEVRKMILLALEHMEDQGVAQGSGYGTLDHFAYHCRMYVPCLFQARHLLKEEGLLKRYNDAAAWFYCRKRVFDDLDATGGDLDDFNTMIVPRFLTILMMDDEAEKVGYLHYFSKKLGQLLLPGTQSGFHSDGSAHHHTMHYPIYMFGATQSITPLVGLLGNTPFRLTEQSHQNFNKAMLLGRVWSNKIHYPIALCGRHPNGDRTIAPDQYFDLAMAGSPDGKHVIDPTMAAAYLRLVDSKGSNAKELIAKGFSAEPDPNGTWVMNQAPSLIIHRHDDWSATLRGLSPYYPSTELYTRENRFGRYQVNGQLEILGPAGNFGSGYRLEGWDWNHFPGTTCVYLPLSELESPTKSSVYMKGKSPFSGAVSFGGQHGLWAMDMKELTIQSPGFVGRKSAFFVGEKIVCLGSAIRSDDAKHPCITTLFQKHLPTPSHPTNVGGQSITSLPHEVQPEQSTSLTDGWGNGYYVPVGQKLQVQRRSQSSRDEDNVRDTTGNFAVAWISHGTSAVDPKYQYVVLPAGADRANEFSKNMQQPGKASYRVVRHDKQAHIVHDNVTGIHAAAFFEPPTELPVDELILGVDRPCLMMYRFSDDHAQISVCDPDLNLKDGEYLKRPVRIAIPGKWQCDHPSVTASTANGRTVLTVTCQAGKPVEFAIERTR